MKALSLRQPWPWFILHGGKNLENRGWTTSFRGPVLIHSSKWWKEDEIGDDFRFASHVAIGSGDLVSPLPRIETLKAELGCIVGVVRMTGWVSSSESDWFFGPKAFVLADPVAFVDPVPCRGERGLFDVSEDVASACRAQIDMVRPGW